MKSGSRPARNDRSLLLLLVGCGQEGAGIGQSASAALADLRRRGELSESAAAKVLAAAAEVEARLEAGSPLRPKSLPPTPGQREPTRTAREAEEEAEKRADEAKTNAEEGKDD